MAVVAVVVVVVVAWVADTSSVEVDSSILGEEEGSFGTHRAVDCYRDWD